MKFVNKLEMKYTVGYVPLDPSRRWLACSASPGPASWRTVSHVNTFDTVFIYIYLLTYCPFAPRLLTATAVAINTQFRFTRKLRTHT